MPAFGVDSSVVAIMMLSRYFPNTNWRGKSRMKQMLYIHCCFKSGEIYIEDHLVWIFSLLKNISKHQTRRQADLSTYLYIYIYLYKNTSLLMNFCDINPFQIFIDNLYILLKMKKSLPQILKSKINEIFSSLYSINQNCDDWWCCKKVFS